MRCTFNHLVMMHCQSDMVVALLCSDATYTGTHMHAPAATVKTMCCLSCVYVIYRSTLGPCLRLTRHRRCDVSVVVVVVLLLR
jgi:hypothetical protein